MVAPNSSVSIPSHPIRPVGSLDSSTRLKIWKDHHVALLYDWLSSRGLSWPHQAVQWGTLTQEELTRRDKTYQAHSTRALYLAERTGHTDDPNTLMHFDVQVVNQLTNKPSEVAKPWQDNPSVTDRADQISTRDFWLRKRLIHPGEVNRMKLVAAHVVVTHTDSDELFVWDFKRQPNRGKNERTPNSPDCTLVGHQAQADYALDVSRQHSDDIHKTLVVSGGSDCNVLIWRLSDYQAKGAQLAPFVSFKGATGHASTMGHTKKVEGVSFNRNNPELVASVGRDSAMIIWDSKAPRIPASIVPNAHVGDVNCVDFGGVHDHLIATGGSDNLVRIWDRRFLTNSRNERKPLRELRGHYGEITNLMWNRHVENVLASGAEDGEVLIWNIGEEGKHQEDISALYRSSPELLFRHVGHNIVESHIADLEWLPSETDPWCMASLSESAAGGSTLQIWRISDLIYRPHEEVAADMRRHARTRNIQ